MQDDKLAGNEKKRLSPEQYTKKLLERQAERSTKVACKLYRDGGPEAIDYPSFSSENIGEIKQWFAGLLDTFKVEKVSWEAVLSLIGTHCFKSPNPAVNSPPLWIELASNADLALVSEGNSIIRKKYIYSGNSGGMGLGSFVLAGCYLDGSFVCLLDVFLAREGVIWDVANEFGWGDAFADLVQTATDKTKTADISKVPLHPAEKQVYFEVEGEDDLLIIPNSGDALLGEMHARIKGNSAIRIIEGATVMPGAPQPQNAGRLFSDLGVLKLLPAIPRAAGTSKERCLAALAGKGRLIGFWCVPSEEIEHVVSCVAEAHRTGRASLRDLENKAYKYLAETILLYLYGIERIIVDCGIDIESPSVEINLHLREWFRARSANRKHDSGCIWALSDYLYSEIIEQHPARGWRARDKSWAFVDNIKNAIEEVLL